MNVNLAVFHVGIRALKRINPLVGIDMTAQFKKFFLALVTLALGAMSSGAMAQVVSLGGNGYSYTSGGVTTNYDLTTISGYSGNAAYFTATPSALGFMPWWGNSLAAYQFSAKASGLFAFSTAYPIQAYSGGGYGIYPSSSTFVVATVASAAAPEIDGALIPQVGLLLAGLFIILGRRKESTEPILAA